MAAGQRLDARAVGLLASLGQSEVTVSRPCRVVVLCTGSELVPLGQPLPPGGIYNSNGPLLRGLLQAGGAQVLAVEQVPDDRARTESRLRHWAEHADWIVSSGGVSVGEEDHLRPALEAVGAVRQWGLGIKPGKPVVWGQVGQGEAAVPVLGLPGNPVSVWVGFLLLGWPLLQQALGRPVRPLTEQAQDRPAAFERPVAGARREFLRARLNAQGQVIVHPNPSSGALSAAWWAQGLVDVPAGQCVTPGDTVRFLPLPPELHPYPTVS